MIELILKVDILVVNEIETAFLTGQNVDSEEEVILAARKLQHFGVETLIISLGKRGALVLTQNESFRIPSFTVDAVDTTAAGDVFCDSLAVAIVEGRKLKEAIRFANSASALSVTKMGAQTSAPKRAESDQFLKKQ